MNQLARTAEVDDYLAALRRELADLPPQELAAVLEDVTPQLLELDSAGLAALGEPAHYAAELRAAAGYEQPEPGSTVVPRLSLVVLVIGTITAAYAGLLGRDLVSNDARYSMPVIALAVLLSAWPVRRFGPSLRDIAGLPEVRAVRALLPAGDDVVTRYLASLLPGWMVLQGVLVGFCGHQVAERLYWTGGLPWVFAVALGLVVAAAGQRSLSDRRWLWLSLPSGVFAVGFLVDLLG